MAMACQYNYILVNVVITYPPRLPGERRMANGKRRMAIKNSFAITGEDKSRHDETG